ncbi:tape measure protein [Heliophilum fasciatum]|uniref:Tape measure domain-containing protein n=1 Tax=Heliophilum fasciatum TaxID=35700 RepID=A0A4R2RFV5_9FIRM|nr:tape measure protein [Heliophilum fasciatum]MCW2278741.1 tape measure domain-containing protein [Heliophilum fasciatum]TCP62520.1 tape measure domain-containing protein [Heliophilum fasciatum]
MSALSSVLVKFTADVSNVQNSIKTAMGQVRDAGKEMGESGGLMGRAFSGFQAVALPAIGAVSTALGGLSLGKGVSFNADLEQAAISFETLLGSVDRAKAMIQDLQQFGASTPFEFPGLQDSAKLMLAMGFQAESVMPNLKALGDAVAAVGGDQEMLKGVTMALGQMATKGKVSAEEMNQLAERGIPAWDLMAQKMGMSKQQLMDLSSQGKIMAEQAVPALIDAMGTKFAGAMDKQSQSFKGMLSTLSDNVNMLLGMVFEPVSAKLKELMPLAINFVNAFSDGFKAGGLAGAIEAIFPPGVAAVINAITAAVTGLFTLLVTNWPIIYPILTGIAAGFAAFEVIAKVQAATAAIKAFSLATSALAGPVGAAVVAIGLLVAAGIYLYQNWGSISAYLSNVWNQVAQAGAAVVQTLTEAWNRISGVAASVFQSVQGAISGAMQSAQGAVESAWAGISRTWNSTTSSIQQMTTEKLGGINTITASAWETMKTLWDEGKVALWGLAVALWQGIMDTFNAAPAKLMICMQTVKETLMNAWNLIKTDAVTMGKNVIMGFVSGLTSFASYLYNAALGVFRRVTDAASRALDIHSPSRVMMQMGKYTAQGFALGMGAEAGTVTAAGQAMAAAAVGGLGGYAAPAMTAPDLSVGNQGNSFNITINGSNGQEIWAELERQLIRRGVKF